MPRTARRAQPKRGGSGAMEAETFVPSRSIVLRFPASIPSVRPVPAPAERHCRKQPGIPGNQLLIRGRREVETADFVSYPLGRNLRKAKFSLTVREHWRWLDGTITTLSSKENVGQVPRMTHQERPYRSRPRAASKNGSLSTSGSLASQFHPEGSADRTIGFLRKS